jgi:hypothetical protein
VLGNERVKRQSTRESIDRQWEKGQSPPVVTVVTDFEKPSACPIARAGSGLAILGGLGLRVAQQLLQCGNLHLKSHAFLNGGKRGGFDCDESFFHAFVR